MSQYDNYTSEMADIQVLCREAAKHKLLSREAEYKLLVMARGDNPRDKVIAYDELIKKNLRLVIKKAREFTGRGLPLEDLVQEGVTGLIRAIEKFDLTKGVKLSTYATRWIEQRVRRALENKSRLVKIPLNRLAQITALKKAYKKYTEDENRPPNSEEIAEILGISQKEAEELGRMMYQHVSLDETCGEEENLSLVNYLVDEKTLPEEKAENLQDKIYVHHLLSFLSKEDADFIKLKMGFLDNKERSIRELSVLLGKPAKELKAREEFILNKLKDIADLEFVNVDP